MPKKGRLSTMQSGPLAISGLFHKVIQRLGAIPQNPSIVPEFLSERTALGRKFAYFSIKEI